MKKLKDVRQLDKCRTSIHYKPYIFRLIAVHLLKNLAVGTNFINLMKL